MEGDGDYVFKNLIAQTQAQQMASPGFRKKKKKKDVKEATTTAVVVLRRMKLTDPDLADDFIEEPEGTDDELPDNLKDNKFLMTSKGLKHFRKLKKNYNPDVTKLEKKVTLSIDDE